MELKVGAITIWGCSPSVFLAKLLHFFLALQCSEVSMAQQWGSHSSSCTWGEVLEIVFILLVLLCPEGPPTWSWGQQPPYPGHERTINVLGSVWVFFKLLFSGFTCTAPCFIVQLSALISLITQFIQGKDTKDKYQNTSKIKCLSSHSEWALCRREQHNSFQEKWNFKHLFL